MTFKTMGGFDWLPIKKIGDKTLILSKDILFRGYFDKDSNIYDQSKLCEYINNKFIATLKENGFDTSFIVNGIWPLTIGQYDMYVKDKVEGVSGSWFLRTPGQEKHITVVTDDGSTGEISITESSGVRPAMMIDTEYFNSFSADEAIQTVPDAAIETPPNDNDADNNFIQSSNDIPPDVSTPENEEHKEALEPNEEASLDVLFTTEDDFSLDPPTHQTHFDQSPKNEINQSQADTPLTTDSISAKTEYDLMHADEVYNQTPDPSTPILITEDVNSNIEDSPLSNAPQTPPEKNIAKLPKPAKEFVTIKQMQDDISLAAKLFSTQLKAFDEQTRPIESPPIINLSSISKNNEPSTQIDLNSTPIEIPIEEFIGDIKDVTTTPDITNNDEMQCSDCNIDFESNEPADTQLERNAQSEFDDPEQKLVMSGKEVENEPLPPNAFAQADSGFNSFSGNDIDAFFNEMDSSVTRPIPVTEFFPSTQKTDSDTAPQLPENQEKSVTNTVQQDDKPDIETLISMLTSEITDLKLTIEKNNRMISILKTVIAEGFSNYKDFVSDIDTLLKQKNEATKANLQYLEALMEQYKISLKNSQKEIDDLKAQIKSLKNGNANY